MVLNRWMTEILREVAMTDGSDAPRDEIRLPSSAWVMAVISFGFVFLGIQFIAGAVTMLFAAGFGGFSVPLLMLIPLSLAGGLLLAWLSARQTVEQVRKKARDQLLQAAPRFVCPGCGEDYSTNEPYCPLCGCQPPSKTFRASELPGFFERP